MKSYYYDLITIALDPVTIVFKSSYDLITILLRSYYDLITILCSRRSYYDPITISLRSYYDPIAILLRWGLQNLGTALVGSQSAPGNLKSAYLCVYSLGPEKTSMWHRKFGAIKIRASRPEF